MAASPLKRARLDDGDLSDASDEPLCEDEEREELCKTAPEGFVTLGTRCVSLGFEGARGKEHAPLFTHQILPPDGRIVNLSQPIVKVRYSHLWRALVTQSWSKVRDQGDPLGDPVSRMLATDFVLQCGKDGFTTDPLQYERWVHDEESGADGPANKLPGRVVWEREQECIRWCDIASEAGDLARRCQALGFWLIETAEYVDLDNKDFFLAYSTIKGTDGVLSLTGYILLIKFRTLNEAQPFTWRICQLVVAPPFSSRGLGRALIRAAHVEAGPDVYEIGVEDPCPAYSRLRLLLDVQACRARGIFFGQSAAVLQALASSKTGRVSAQMADKVRSELKIVARQVQLCFEVAWYAAAKASASPDALTNHRLAVKKRLYFDNEEDLDKTALDFKSTMENLFVAETKEYDSVLRALEVNADTNAQ